MNETVTMCPRGMVVTPHHLATQSALAILREGGTAMEATVAAAATIAVVYPHMNSIGGDSFWLIAPPHEDPFVIEACGAAGSLADEKFFAGLSEIPLRGPKSALTVAGTVGGWENALSYVSECGYTRLSLANLLADAIKYAKDGYAVTKNQVDDTHESNQTYISQEFEKIFMPNGQVPKEGDKLCQINLAKTLEMLVENGLNSFYRGDLAKIIAADLEALGIPITLSDLENYIPVRKAPLQRLSKYGVLYNTPPPTQGVVSMLIFGILEKLGIDGKNQGELIHSTIEATKLAFEIRDKYITDPAHMSIDEQTLISNDVISEIAQKVNPHQASNLGKGKGSGDTIWIGVMDDKGFSVSFIQSIYKSFGSGMVLPRTGIIWHNRGISFNLSQDHLLSLKPAKKPFHTLNPSAAKLHDGRIIVYGTRGGDGQGPIQAVVLHRYVIQGLPLQKSVALPRCFFGKLDSNQKEDCLILEDRFSEDTVQYLKDRGHSVLKLPAFHPEVGEAGILVRHPNGFMEGAFDPRSNGSAAGY